MSLKFTLIIAFLTGVVSPLAAESFTWTGEAGNADWHAWKRITNTSPYEWVNNFGRTATTETNTAPKRLDLLPGKDDSVTIPEGATAIVSSDHAQAGTLSVSGSLTVSARTLELHSGLSNAGTVTLGNNGVLALLSDVDSVTNNGRIQFTYSSSRLQLGRNVSFAGSGEIWSSAGGTISGDHTLINAAPHTIRGYGVISVNLDNRGVVRADSHGTTLSLKKDLANHGTLEARGNGTLSLESSITQAAGAVIHAAEGTVALNGCSIQNGTLQSAEGRMVQVNGSNSLANVKNEGLIRVYNNATIALQDTITNDGVIEFYYASSTLKLNSDVTFAGSGEVWNNAGGTISGDYTLTNTASHTIRGRGTLAVALINEGVIRADHNGGTLSVKQGVENANLLEATGNSTLSLSGLVKQGENARVTANGGTVSLAGCTIRGGALQRTGNSLINTTAALNVLENLHNQAWVRVGSVHTLALGGTIHNDGTLEIYYTSSKLRLDSDVILEGNGEIWGNDPGTILSNEESEEEFVLANTANHTIRGRATIAVAVVNEGVIRADRNGSTLALTQGAENQGLLEATDNGILSLAGLVEQEEEARIIANGGTVSLAGCTIRGGALQRTGNSLINTTAALNALENLHNQAWVRVGSVHTLALRGTIHNDGTLEIYYTSSKLRLDSDVVLEGNGEIWGNDPGTILSNEESEEDFVLANTANHTIRGRATIAVAVVNEGVIRADRNGSTLALTQGAENQGLLEATGNGILSLAGLVEQEEEASIMANGGTVNLAGGTIRGGILQRTGSSLVNTTAALNALENLHNQAWVRVGSAHTLALRGTIHNDGTLEIYYTSSKLRLDSDVVLEGSGEIWGNDPGTILSNVESEEDFVLTNTANHTIRGRAAVSVLLDNQGTVKADRNGSTLNLSGGLVQFSEGKLTGGTWIAVGNGILAAPGLPGITVNQAKVEIDGNGSKIPMLSALTNNQGEMKILNRGIFTTTANFENSGLLALGTGGTLAVKGDFAQSAGGRMRMDLIGPSSDAAAWGRVTATGEATLAGNIEVWFLRFGPFQIGNTWRVVQSASRSGEFHSTLIRHTPLGMVSDLVSDGNGVLVELGEGVMPDTFDEWARQMDFDHPEDALPDADVDGDGLSNLVEYAFDLNPFAPDPADAVTRGFWQDGILWLWIGMPDPARADILYTAQVSADLAVWQPVARKDGVSAWTWLGGGSARMNLLPAGDGRSPMEAGMPEAWDGDPRAFLNLKVERRQ